MSFVLLIKISDMKGFKQILMVLLLATGLFAAKCDDDIISNKNGYFKDMTGLDGCRFVIELDDGERIQPMNMNEFDIEPKDGMQVKLSYVIDKEAMSICMAGTTVQLVKIRVIEK